MLLCKKSLTELGMLHGNVLEVTTPIGKVFHSLIVYVLKCMQHSDLATHVIVGSRSLCSWAGLNEAIQDQSVSTHVSTSLF